MTDLRISNGRCQFCHRTADDVEQMISGDSAFICNNCVNACVAVLRPAEPAQQQQIAPDPYVFQRLASHFSPLDPREMVTTSRTYPLRQQADLQGALDELLGARIIPVNFVGLNSEYSQEVPSFSKLISKGHYPVQAGPAQYEDVDIGGAETVHCLKNGLWLLHEDATPYVVVLAQNDNYGRRGDAIVEVATPAGELGLEICTRIFETLEKRLSVTSCYRGRILSLELQDRYSGHVPRICVHQLDAVPREELILSEETIRLVERNVLDFAKQRNALRELGLSTQKGLLFHGAPGTGKTHCIRYLAAQLKGHTTLLITAEGAGMLPEYMSLARLLQPALVIIEDADLIARERTDRSDACDEVMLNRLLNEMDGLRERADVFFILTTNRPETLEPALASRPGRIDQRVSFELPDEQLRKQLVSLYARGLRLSEVLSSDLAKRLDGASPALIKELLRRIAQHHLESGEKGEVSTESAEAAMDEMLFSNGSLNTTLLARAQVILQ